MFDFRVVRFGPTFFHNTGSSELDFYAVAGLTVESTSARLRQFLLMVTCGYFLILSYLDLVMVARAELWFSNGGEGMGLMTLSATPSSSACSVDSSEFDAFLLHLRGGCDPVDDVESFVQYWVQA